MLGVYQRLFAWCVGCLFSLCTACGNAPVQTELKNVDVVGLGVATPVLRLPPSMFVGSMSLTQRLNFSRLDGKANVTQSIDALLEIDANHLQLAGFALGQRILSMRWDGRTLDVQAHPRLPPAASPVRILSDIQYVYWPVNAINATLPVDQGWQFRELDQERELTRAGSVVLKIRYQTERDQTGKVILENVRDGYRLVIESTPSM